MISGSAGIGSDWFLNGISNLQRQQLKTQQDLSSGYSVRDAADAPAQTPQLVRLGAELASVQSYQANLTQIQTEAQAADAALSAGISLVEQARTLAVRGANTITSAADRQNIAVQIQGIQQQLVSIANTTSAGRHIFAGDLDRGAPYQLDAASATGVDPLDSQPSTRVFRNSDGDAVYRWNTAAAIFDPHDVGGAPSASNSFAALQNLQTALQANDSAGISNALNSLEGASDWLNQQQAAYGTAEQRITQEKNTAATQVTNIQAGISAIRDTDVAKAATDLAQENTSQAAAFGAQARISAKSLFDYLA